MKTAGTQRPGAPSVSAAEHSPWHAARLSANPAPLGWSEPAAAVPVAELRPDDPHYRSMRAQNKAPKGARKLWRYFKTLLTLLRRPTIVTNAPIHLQMESTDACNLHCTTCTRDLLVSKASLLEESYWRGVIDQTRPTNLNVSGIGEPFLHPGIFDMIAYAKKSGAAVNCATNFTRVRGRHREIVESGIDQLKVSIDAANPETYFAIRGEDSWQHILDNVKQVNEWKEKLGVSTPSIRFNFALQAYNYEQVPDLIRLAHAHGVDGCYIQYLEYVDADDRKGMLTGTMTEEGLRGKLEEAEALAAELGVITNLEIWWRDWDIFWNKMQPIAEFEPNCKSCYFPWFSAWIGADGWVRPCPIMPWTHDEGRMGHLGKQSFQEIWNSPKYRALRAALARGERPTRSCKTCVPQSLKNILFLRSKLLPDNKKGKK